MFWDNFAALCTSKGISPNAAAKELGLSSGSVTAWKKGATPRNSALTKIADYFGVSTYELTRDATVERAITRAILATAEKEKPADQKADGLRGTGYDLLTPENKGMIDSLIAKLLESQSGE